MIVKIELGNENLKKFLMKNIIKLNKNNSYQLIILTEKSFIFNKYYQISLEFEITNL